ncbi:hypothetical protein E2C01_089656 [Portunus trituberculatus]|uniref:Uncharacterized protein n=1 Tax=Portunus trituberculatus TaxID=210409 RepID=A0A5B7JIU4_PORTR|nr:hypothetical protein [Portunus trituberculatus]
MNEEERKGKKDEEGKEEEEEMKEKSKYKLVKNEEEERELMNEWGGTNTLRDERGRDAGDDGQDGELEKHQLFFNRTEGG